MIRKLLFFWGLFCSFSMAFSQNTITVPFNDGFVGVNGGSNVADNAYHLTYLGFKNVQFSQNSPSNVFVAQGNDIIGNVIITDNNNVEYTIPGFIKWRTPSGNSPNTPVFQPGTGTNVTLATNGANGSGTYVINDTKYIGLTFNGNTLTFAENTSVTGNAATQGLLELLNSYLGTLPSLSISDATANEANPNVSLTVSLSAVTSNTVKVNYTTSNNSASAGINFTTTTGTLTIPANSASQNIVVPMINNPQSDSGKTFYVTLSDPTNAYILDQSGTVTIIEAAGNSLIVNNPSDKIEFGLVQNPVKNGVATFEFNNAKNAQVSVFDTNGKLIRNISLKSNSGRETADVSSLPKGVYVVVLKSLNQVAVTKMLVQ